MEPTKFRAWDKKEKKMFYFDKDYSSSDNEGIPCLTNKKADYFISYNDLFDVEQKNYIPLQFIGLKDKRGKEIYEGDILKRFVGKGGYPADKDGFMIDSVEFPDDYKYLKCEWRNCEIIGNIMENKELLKT